MVLAQIEQLPEFLAFMGGGGGVEEGEEFALELGQFHRVGRVKLLSVVDSDEQPCLAGAVLPICELLGGQAGKLNFLEVYLNDAEFE